MKNFLKKLNHKLTINWEGRAPTDKSMGALNDGGNLKDFLKMRGTSLDLVFLTEIKQNLRGIRGCH
jgi:hypothetical protein